MQNERIFYDFLIESSWINRLEEQTNLPLDLPNPENPEPLQNRPFDGRVWLPSTVEKRKFRTSSSDDAYRFTYDH